MSAPLIRATWPIPIAIGVTSVMGLVAALTGDGWRDGLSWLGLAGPVAALAWAHATRQRHHKQTSDRGTIT